MRALILLSGFFAVAFGAWHLALRPDPASLDQAAQAQREHQIATAGIRGFLDGAAQPRISRAVIGRSAVTGEWEVRGMTDGRAGERPAYAVLAGRCAPADLADPACWSFVRLEIDGVDQTGAASAAPAAVAADLVAADAAPDGGEVDEPEPAAAEPAVVEPAAVGPSAVGPPPRLFEIAVAAVNLREGPGTQFPAVGVARRGERFALVEEQSGWGRFAGPANGADTAVWISMTLVRPVGE